MQKNGSKARIYQDALKKAATDIKDVDWREHASIPSHQTETSWRKHDLSCSQFYKHKFDGTIAQPWKRLYFLRDTKKSRSSILVKLVLCVTKTSHVYKFTSKNVPIEWAPGVKMFFSITRDLNRIHRSWNEPVENIFLKIIRHGKVKLGLVW